MQHAFFLALFLAFVSLTAPQLTFAQENPPAEEIAEAVVTQVLENGTIIDEAGVTHRFQELELLGTTGKHKGKMYIVENGVRNQTGFVEYEKGDEVMLSMTRTPDGQSFVRITDYVRRLPLLILLGLFVFLTVLIGGIRGFTSILGMVITFGALFFFVLPRIMSGDNPYLITGIAATFLIPITFLLAHGINKKTWCAIGGTFVALGIACLLSYALIEQAHMRGFAS